MENGASYPIHSSPLVRSSKIRIAAITLPSDSATAIASFRLSKLVSCCLLFVLLRSITFVGLGCVSTVVLVVFSQLLLGCCLSFIDVLAWMQLRCLQLQASCLLGNLRESLLPCEAIS